MVSNPTKKSSKSSLNQKKPLFAIALLHYPVYNKNHDVTASAITLLDIHDSSRVARTYDLPAVFIVTPVESQQRIAKRTLGYWTKGYGKIYNPDRHEALSLVHVTKDLKEAQNLLKEHLDLSYTPPIIATSARKVDGANFITFNKLKKTDKVFILAFGTAWGLTDEFIQTCDYLLEPIKFGDYNHLSVRAAIAIIVDRLRS